MKYTTNEYGIRIKKSCASCSHKSITRAVTRRRCMKNKKTVSPHDVCSKWQMAKHLMTVGRLQDSRKNICKDEKE